MLFVWLHATPDSTDSKVHRANIGPIWGRQDPGGPHVGPMNFAIWDIIFYYKNASKRLLSQKH